MYFYLMQLNMPKACPYRQCCIPILLSKHIMSNYFEKKEKFNKERERYYKEKNNLRLKYAAFISIAISIALLLMIIFLGSAISKTTMLFMRGCAGVFALIFFVLVVILTYRVNVAYFKDRANRKTRQQ